MHDSNFSEISKLHKAHKHRSLADLAVGGQAQVASVQGDTELRRRLLEMGFVNGVEVTVVRRAPLGDPIEFRLRGYNLSLRRDQARHVHVKD